MGSKASSDQEAAATSIEQVTPDLGRLGIRLRALRENRGMNLVEASAATGVRPGTLSRIETGKMTPSFALVVRVMRGLRLSWAEVMNQQEVLASEPEPSFAAPGEARRARIGSYDYDVLHGGSSLLRNLSPYIVQTTATRLADVGGLMGHQGTEFCYLLSGRLRLHFEGRPAMELEPGASALFDSGVPHAYVAVGRAPARMLIVLARDPLLAEAEARTSGLGVDTGRGG